MTGCTRASALTIAAAILLVACSTPPPSASPSAGTAGPSASVAPSSSDSADPRESTPPIVSGVPAGEVVQVVADELRLRDEPGTAGTLVGTLERGTAVRLESGPVQADGYTWFEVLDITGQRGWAADGDGVDAWLAEPSELNGKAPILALSRACDVPGPFNVPLTTVFDDRTVLVTMLYEGGWFVRRLSEAGMQDVRVDVLGSPYLQESAEFFPEPLPGAEPPGHGLCVFRFEITTDGPPIVVTSVGWFGDAEETEFYVPSPERKALDGIARNLIDIDAVLDDRAWVAPSLPYLAGDFTLFIGDGIGPAPDAAPELDPTALGIGDPDAFGDPAGSGRCATVSREVAFEIVRVLSDVDVVDPVRIDNITYASIRTDTGWLSMILAPQTHDGVPDCSMIAF